MKFYEAIKFLNQCTITYEIWTVHEILVERDNKLYKLNTDTNNYSELNSSYLVYDNRWIVKLDGKIIPMSLSDISNIRQGNYKFRRVAWKNDMKYLNVFISQADKHQLYVFKFVAPDVYIKLNDLDILSTDDMMANDWIIENDVNYIGKSSNIEALDVITKIQQLNSDNFIVLSFNGILSHSEPSNIIFQIYKHCEYENNIRVYTVDNSGCINKPFDISKLFNIICSLNYTCMIYE